MGRTGSGKSRHGSAVLVSACGCPHLHSLLPLPGLGRAACWPRSFGRSHWRTARFAWAGAGTTACLCSSGAARWASSRRSPVHSFVLPVVEFGHLCARDVSLTLAGSQESVLFAGPLVDSIDPLHMHTESDLWRVLEHLELRAAVRVRARHRPQCRVAYLYTCRAGAAVT